MESFGGGDSPAVIKVTSVNETEFTKPSTFWSHAPFGKEARVVNTEIVKDASIHGKKPGLYERFLDYLVYSSVVKRI